MMFSEVESYFYLVLPGHFGFIFDVHVEHFAAMKSPVDQTKQAFRNAEKVFTKRVQRMSDGVLSEEIMALVEQLKKLSQDLGEGSNTEDLRRRSKAIDRKLAIVKEEQVKRAELDSLRKNHLIQL